MRRLCGTQIWDPRLRDVWTPIEPFSAPPGTTLRFTAAYDNSENNRRNPSRPPREVMRGPAPTDEACALEVVLVDE